MKYARCSGTPTSMMSPGGDWRDRAIDGYL